MLVVINFADDKFKQQQIDNCETAITVGKADKVIGYRPEDIDEAFKESYKDIFSFDRGYGLWIWKAYFTLRTFELMNEGDYLFYCDAGTYFVNDLHHLIKTMEAEGAQIMPFELPLLERQWTKMEAFKRIGVGNFDNNQCLAGYFLTKKSQFAIRFFTEWLNYMGELVCISPEQITDTCNFSDFIAHREDQSVYSLLCHKYGLKTFRDPSQFGDWPWLYKKDYAIFRPLKYTNSPYPRIVVSNRRIIMKKYKRHIRSKDFLALIGIYHLLYIVKHSIRIIFKGKDSREEANKQ